MKAVLVCVVGLLALSLAVPVPESKVTETSVQPEPKVDVDKVKQSALEQVMAFVSEMAQPMSEDEHKALKDIITTGSEILMEAERKAKEIHTKFETMNLLQTDTLFTTKPDGSLDSDLAATQLTDVLSSLAPASNPLTNEEKTVLHDLIGAFARAFVPTKHTTEALQGDFDKLVQGFSSRIGEIMTQFGGLSGAAGAHDDLLNPQALLSVFGAEDGKSGFDTKLITELTEKFLNTMEAQLDSHKA